MLRLLENNNQFPGDAGIMHMYHSDFFLCAGRHDRIGFEINDLWLQIDGFVAKNQKNFVMLMDALKQIAKKYHCAYIYIWAELSDDEEQLLKSCGFKRENEFDSRFPWYSFRISERNL